MSTLDAWAVIDANNNAVPPDGWPENTMQYSEVNNTGRAVQGTLRRFFGDINGSLAAAGVANAYTLTLNETGYTSYFVGMYFVCSIPATNTGPTTINVNGIGVQNVLSNGVALAGGELGAGCIHTFRYDGTQFQLSDSGGGVAASGRFTNPSDIDLVDTDVALNVGAVDPDTELHIEVSPYQIQVKDGASNVDELQIQPFGGDLTFGHQETSPGGPWAMTFLRNEENKFDINENFEFFSDDLGTETTPDPIELLLRLRSFNANFYADLGFSNSIDLGLTNYAYGGDINLIATTAAGAAETLLQTQPAAVGGLLVNNTLTGGGLERVLTTSDATGGFDPASNQTITGDWKFDNPTNGLELAGGTELNFDRATGAGRVQFQYNAGSIFNATVTGDDVNAIDFWFNATWEATRFQNPLRISTSATPVANIAGYGQLYAGSGTTGLFWRKFDGTDYELGLSGVSIPPSTGSNHTLRGDGAGGWAEETAATISAAGQIRTTGSLSLSDGTDQLTLSTTAGVTQAFGTGGYAYLDLTTINVRAADLRLQETASPAIPGAGFGRFFPKSVVSPNRPAFVDDTTTTYDLQTVQPSKVFTNQNVNMNSGTFPDAEEIVGGLAEYSDGSNYTITLETSATTDFSLRSSFDIFNAGSGVITINASAGGTLFWLDGQGMMVLAGSRTVSVGGVASVYRSTASNWYIYGSGIA